MNEFTLSAASSFCFFSSRRRHTRCSGVSWARLAYARGQPTSSARGGMQKPTATFKRQAKGASMGKKTILFLAIAIVAMVILPATAFGAGLINEYGMHYAGQSTCTGCHGAEIANQVHG